MSPTRRLPLRGAGIALAVLAGTSALPAAPARAQGSDSTSLAATTAPPWIPERTVSAAEPWETAVRLPGRIVSLPFSAVGALTRGSLLYVERNSVVPRTLAVLASSRRLGVTVLPASLGDRTGWGGEVRFSPPFFRPLLGELSGSTRKYSQARLELAFGPAAIDYSNAWRPRDPFFGVGLDAAEQSRTSYAAKIQRARILVEWPFVPRRMIPGPMEGMPPELLGAPPVRASTRASAWFGPRDVTLRDGRESPSLTAVFPALAASQLDTHVGHLAYGAMVEHDGRHGHPHWTHGWRARLEAERYDKASEHLALNTAMGARPFTRLTYEAEGGVSFYRDPRTLRLLARVVDQRLNEGPGVFLISDAAELGGRHGLFGFEPGRFRDLDLVLTRLTYVFPLAKHLELDLHAEAGGVFPDLEGARMDRLEHSIGVALRPRVELAPLGAVGVDVSREGARVRFSIGGVE